MPIQNASQISRHSHVTDAAPGCLSLAESSYSATYKLFDCEVKCRRRKVQLNASLKRNTEQRKRQRSLADLVRKGSLRGAVPQTRCALECARCHCLHDRCAKRKIQRNRRRQRPLQVTVRHATSYGAKCQNDSNWHLTDVCNRRDCNSHRLATLTSISRVPCVIGGVILSSSQARFECDVAIDVSTQVHGTAPRVLRTLARPPIGSLPLRCSS